jgi:hypothetical protein
LLLAWLERHKLITAIALLHLPIEAFAFSGERLGTPAALVRV